VSARVHLKTFFLIDIKFFLNLKKKKNLELPLIPSLHKKKPITLKKNRKEVFLMKIKILWTCTPP
jgi:hypothetical protein